MQFQIYMQIPFQICLQIQFQISLQIPFQIYLLSDRVHKVLNDLVLQCVKVFRGSGANPSPTKATSAAEDVQEQAV
jgi:hypothetical protein